MTWESVKLKTPFALDWLATKNFQPGRGVIVKLAGNLIFLEFGQHVGEHAVEIHIGHLDDGKNKHVTKTCNEL